MLYLKYDRLVHENLRLIIAKDAYAAVRRAVWMGRRIATATVVVLMKLKSTLMTKVEKCLCTEPT